jgi:serine/threonine protein kinase/Tfp pilus assembly protein PilF
MHEPSSHSRDDLPQTATRQRAHERLMSILGKALKREPSQRAAYLEEACAGEPALRRDVQELLEMAPTAGAAFDEAERHAVLHAEALATLAPGSIGPYHVLDLIGEGGMGAVYKAEQREPLRRIVAVKLIKPGYDSRQIVARFESERQALARMDHPNIARVLDAGMTDSHRPYFVMEFVPGVPVTQFCDDNRLTLRERLGVFIEICKAIAHAHTKAMIHRDIKSRNVLAFMHDGKPAVKVIDFGIAKAVTGDRLTDHTFSTSLGEVVGTYDSMSPEQVDASPDIDTRTDIYSLGVLLYELLSGSKPFDSATLKQASDQEMRRIVRDVEPATPSARLTELGAESQQIALNRRTDTQLLATALRRELEWIPLMALRKERHRRYESVQQLQADVENYLAGRALLAGPESRVYRIRKALGRHRGVVSAAALIAFLLIAGVAATTWQAFRARRAERAARSERAEALQQAAIAQAVNRFQLDMLRAADPYQMLGEKVTVLDAARAALKRLDEGQLKDQPLVEAAVRDTIGDTLRALSLYDQAEPVLRVALHLRRNALPPDHPDVAQSMNQLATLLQELGEHPESEWLFREALRIRVKVLPGDHPDIATSTNNLATLLRAAGKMDEVPLLFEQALAIRRKSLPLNHPDIAQSLNNLAAVLHAQGKLGEAEGHLRESLRIKLETLPRRHPMIADILDSLGMVLLEQGKLDEASELLHEAMGIRQATLPATHREIAVSLTHVATVCRQQGALDKAVAFSRAACDIRRQRFGPDHQLYAESLTSLATLLHEQGKAPFPEAARLFRESLEIQNKLGAPDQRTLAATLGNLGALLVEQDNASEAEPLIRKGVEIRLKVLPATDPELARSISDLGVALRKLNRLPDAEQYFRQAADLRQKVAHHDELAAQSLHNLGAVLVQQQKDSQAVAPLTEALRIRKSRFGAQDSRTQRTATALAAVFTRLGQPADAETLRREYQPQSTGTDQRP